MTSTPEQRRATLQRHFELFNRGHDDPSVKAEWLDLFTDDCSTEEPVGSVPRAAVQSDGWDMTHGGRRVLWLEPERIVVSDSTPEAATVVRLRLTLDGEPSDQVAIGTWSFSDDGRIAASRIFVESDQLGPEAWESVGGHPSR